MTKKHKDSQDAHEITAQEARDAYDEIAKLRTDNANLAASNRRLNFLVKQQNDDAEEFYSSSEQIRYNCHRRILIVPQKKCALSYWQRQPSAGPRISKRKARF